MIFWIIGQEDYTTVGLKAFSFCTGKIMEGSLILSSYMLGRFVREYCV